MSPRRSLAPVLGLGLLLFGCTGEAGTIETLREWHYRRGFDPTWIVGPIEDPSQWNTVLLPRNLSALPELAADNYTGWITLRTDIPAHLNEQLRSGSPLAFNAGRVLDVSRYYINGRQFGQLGSDQPYVDAAMRPFIHDIPFDRIETEQTNVLAVALYNNGKYPLQFMDEPEVGQSDSVYLARSCREITAFAFLMFYVASGLYHLLLFARRRKDRYNLFFALFALIVAVYWFVANTTTRDFIFANHVELHRKLEHALLFLVVPAAIFFLTQFFNGRYTRFGLAYGAFCLVLFLATLTTNLDIMRICRDVWFVSLILSLSYCIFYVAREIKRGNPDATFLILGIIVLVAATTNDVLSSQGYIQTPKVANYSFLLFVGGLAALMANRFMRVTGRVEELNRDLEKKVEDRTRELQATLDQVQELKVQQDGDYFLTSLLVNPLAGNFTRGGKVTVETLTRQKKRFHFRKWDSEIGGDISIADSITLHDRRYTVFINADAMGKSMQGAGGALVLGTVFRSVLARTHARQSMQARYAEIWLRDCLLELQTVFQSFDGSMLISAILGLVDEENGTLYYLNAEHPYAVLYRNGRASFLDSDNALRKVGVEGLADMLRITTHQLQPGDVLILGSDGRDDVLLGHGDDGARQINEDETMFLRRVEEGGGVLAKIEQSLLASGALTDDLSLLRLAWLEDAAIPEEPRYPDAFLRDRDEGRRALREGRLDDARAAFDRAAAAGLHDPILLRDRARLEIRTHNFEQGLLLAERALQENDNDPEMIYLASYACKVCGNPGRAIELGERLRLRDPDLVRNLVNLADSYRLEGNRGAALLLLDRVRELEPDNSSVLKLAAVLEKDPAPA